MKRILAVFFALLVCLGTASGVFAASKNFTDVKVTDWFYNDVKAAVELGLVNGKTETTYAPNDNLTYAEAIKLAACMHQLYTTGTINIKAGDPWYKPYVNYCKENNITKTEYNYQQNATRAGYMGIFANALPGDGLKAINKVSDNSIPDVPSSADYAEGVYKLYRAGILQGVDAAHNCNPDNHITRSEVAAILTRMMNADKRVKFTLGEEKEETNEKLAIQTQPEDATVNFEKAATFSVKATGGTAPYSYQWMYYVDNVWRDVSADLGEASGEKTANVSIMNFSHGTVKIRCVVTDAKGEKVISDTVEFITNEAKTEPLTVTQHPIGGALHVGGTIKTNIIVSGGVAPYSYQWEYNDGSGWKNVTDELGKVEGDKTSKISIKSALPASYKVRCVIKDAKGNEAVTNETDFTFNALNELRIEKEPENATVELGTPVTASVKATGGTEPYAYHWHCLGEDAWYSLINSMGSTGADSANLSITTSSATAMAVRCTITDAKGASVTSKTVDLIVTSAKEEPKVEEKNTEPLKITQQPAHADVDVEETAVFSVAVEGGTPDYTYHWYYETCDEGKLYEFNDKSKDGITVSGAKTATLSVTKSLPEIVNVFCNIKDAKGNIVTSKKVNYAVVSKSVFAFETHPQNVTVNVGEDAKVSVKVINGVGTYTYLWQMSLGNGLGWARLSDQDMISGVSTPELTLKSKAAATIDVRCVVKDSAGTIIESNSATITFK